jgi:hypothetical protein
MTPPANSVRVWALLALVAWWLSPALALAQAAAGGNGIKVGTGRLHPTFEFEARLDTAVGYFPVDPLNPTTVKEEPSPEAVLHLRPGLQYELPHTSRVALQAQGQLDYVHYTGLLTEGSTAGSRLEGLADVSARFNEEGQVSLDVTDHFQRSDRTRSIAVVTGVLSLFNELRLSVPVKPGGGAIEVTPELGWALEFFQPTAALSPEGCTEPTCDPAVVEQLNYTNLRMAVRGRWRFLPKTAVLVDARVDSRHSLTANNFRDATLLNTSVGIAGLVSPKIAATAKVGWAQAIGGVEGGTLVAQLEGTYMMGATSLFKGGYLRTLEPVTAYGLFRDDRVYVEGEMLLGGRLTLKGLGSMDFLTFEDPNRPRSDTLLRVDVGLEYPLKQWIALGGGYLLGVRTSSSPGGGLNYTRHEGYVRVSLRY